MSRRTACRDTAANATPRAPDAGRRFLDRACWRVGLLALAAVTSGCTGEPIESAPAAGGEGDVVILTAEAMENAGIEIGSPRTLQRIDVEEAPGVLVLDETRTARVGSVVDGIVIQTAAEVGMIVRPQQVLAGIHSIVVHDAWAAYRTAVADERRLTNEVAFAEEAEARAERLIAAKAISEQQRLRAVADRVSAVERLDMARTEVRRSLDELDHYGLAPEDVSPGRAEVPVRSPIAGTVLERFVTQGTAVTVGMPLYVVSDLGTLWAIAEVDETQLSRVVVGRDVEVRVAAYPNETFEGTITYIGESINPRTRRVAVRSTVPNPGNRLKPEMYATVALGQGDAREIVTVPNEAVQDLEGRPVVFVAEPEGRFQPRQVTLGSEQDGWTEIRTGLDAGERVVSRGAFLVKSELLRGTLDEGE